MDYRLQDLIDLEQFQHLLDQLNSICSFPTAILDNEGHILTASAWQDVCTKFHRVNAECAKDCAKSDSYIQAHLHEANPFVSYHCMRGLVDCAAPIVIDGVHYGDFFIGQFFLEQPDLDFFRGQARRFGFDEEAYLDAVKKVSIRTREQLTGYQAFIIELISVICESGLKKLREIEARKRIEESEERAAAILEQMHDGFLTVNARDERIVDVNGAMCRMMGRSREELLRMSVADLVAEASPETVERRLQEAIRTGSGRFEVHYRRGDGNVLDLEAGVTYLEKHGLFFGFFRDVTARKRAEEQVHRNEARLRGLVNILQFRSKTAKEFLDTAIAEAVRLTESRTGYIFAYEEGRKAFLLEALCTEAGKDRGELEEAGVLEEAVNIGAPVIRNACPGRSEGHIGPSRFLSVPIFRENRIVAVAGVTDKGGDYEEADVLQLTLLMDAVWKSVDIQKGEEALRNSEQKYRSLVDNATEAILVAQNDRFQFVNRYFIGLMNGYTEEELTSIPFTDLIHPDDRALVHGNYRRRTEGGEVPKRYSFRVLPRDGTVKWVEVNSVLIEWRGKPATLNFLVDVTENRRTEEERGRLQAQLLQAQKMESVGRLAGGVAHDFNNMLSVILGHAEMALDLVEPDQALHADLLEIRKAATRSTDLTRQLLAFARKQIVAPKTLDLNETVESMLKMLKRLIGEDIDLAWKPCALACPVLMDPSQIDQILANLCINARDAIAGVGRIVMETDSMSFDEAYCADHDDYVPGRYVMLAVSDDGCGMDKETLDKLFEPFFTTKELGKGTGLGLATVYGIVKQNNGFLNVYSEPRRGTTFRIYLPWHGAEAGPVRKEPQAERIPRGRETVLVVEDEPANLRMTAKMLESLGYTVLTAADPETAGAKAKKHAGAMRLLLTDVIMPRMNGRDLAQNLVGLHPDLKLLFMSGYTADVIAHRGILDEGMHFIQKPFSIHELASKVREALDG